MKIYLLNDTKHNHSGCDAVMDMVDYYLSPYPVIAKMPTHNSTLDEQAFAEADTVIMNGEGTLHDNQDSAVKFLSIIEKAQQQGKRTAIFNASWFDMPERWNAVLKNLDYLAVREIMSYRNVKDIKPDTKMFLDLSINERFANETSDKPFQTFAVGDFHPDTPNKFMLTYPYERITLSEPFSTVVAKLKNVKYYITGQFHGVCASILAGCYIVPLASNTQKIKSLINWGGVSIPMLRAKRKLAEVVVTSLENYHVFRTNILSKPKMQEKDFKEMLNA